jgi:hypothetical protein
VFAGIRSEDYLKALQRFVDQGLPPEAPNAAEDLIWSSQSWAAVDARTRREVAQALEAAGPFWSDPDGLLTSVERRFVDHDPGGVWTGRGLIDAVSQHMLRNDDSTALDLFKRIGARDSPSNPASEHEHETLCRQANWFARTYDQLVGNVEVAVASDGRSQQSDPSSGENRQRKTQADRDSLAGQRTIVRAEPRPAPRARALDDWRRDGGAHVISRVDLASLL